MRPHLLPILLVALPLAAHAQEANRAASPMLVVAPQQQQAAPTTTPAAAPAPAASELAAQKAAASFPDWAVTQIGQKTSGVDNGVVAPPASPANPAAPASAQNPANPASPATPASPANPAAKLWPKDTVPIFLQSCANFHVELIAPCSCVITNLMLSMGHDEFLAKSEAGTIEADARLIKARSECATAPQRKE